MEELPWTVALVYLIVASMYRFYRYRRGKPWALVTRSEAPLPPAFDQQDWELTRDRTSDDTNADVRQHVDEHGYCLLENECSFEDLARELVAAGPEAPSLVPDSTSTQVASPAEYQFYVHRRLRAWRMALRSVECVAQLTRMTDWRFSRSRTGENTAPAVRSEIAARGYSLFKIGGSLAAER
jgi:hypothetical protein